MVASTGAATVASTEAASIGIAPAEHRLVAITLSAVVAASTMVADKTRHPSHLQSGQLIVATCTI